jgi:hemerythrin-like domain-containing protein
VSSGSSATAMAAVQCAHRSAEAVVQTILAVADSLEQGRRIEISLLQKVVAFLRTFADQCQEAEEDALLFPALEAKCSPSDAGMIENLKNDHQKLVTLTSELSVATDEYVAANGSAKEHLTSCLRRLTALYREYIWNEDHIVLPLAEKILSPEELNALFQAFQGIESEISLNEAAKEINQQAQRCPCHMGEVFF